jgi:hypothetical protein
MRSRLVNTARCKVLPARMRPKCMLRPGAHRNTSRLGSKPVEEHTTARHENVCTCLRLLGFLCTPVHAHGHVRTSSRLFITALVFLGERLTCHKDPVQATQHVRYARPHSQSLGVTGLTWAGKPVGCKCQASTTRL